MLEASPVTTGQLFSRLCLNKQLYVKKNLCKKVGNVKAIWNVLQMNKKHLWEININCQDPASHFVAVLNASAVTGTVRCWHYNYSLILEEWIIIIANTLISHTHNYIHSPRKDRNIKIPSLNRLFPLSLIYKTKGGEQSEQKMYNLNKCNCKCSGRRVLEEMEFMI